MRLADFTSLGRRSKSTFDLFHICTDCELTFGSIMVELSVSDGCNNGSGIADTLILDILYLFCNTQLVWLRVGHALKNSSVM